MPKSQQKQPETKLGKSLKDNGARMPKDDANREPLWKGPELDGVTQSMLSRFLVCRERFRLLVVCGLKPADAFEPRIQYGNMWHLCEEYIGQKKAWEEPLREYCRSLCKRYPHQQEQVQHWYEMCKAQFPVYEQFWLSHPEVVSRVDMFHEEVFNVPYKLPSGRVVRLRGKWDGVDLIEKGLPKNEAGIYIQENKTKSSIDSQKIQRQMDFDLQTMMYHVALEEWLKTDPHYNGDPKPVVGVRYNVIRRSQHKSADSMLKKIEEDLRNSRGAEWFARWRVVISPEDVTRFKHEFFHPVLEGLCDWWHHISTHNDPFITCGGKAAALHWRHPFGVYNVLDEGGSSNLDEYLASGSEVGLQRATSLYEELE